AARTFPLACPPSVAPADVAYFVDTHLSAARFAEYLGDRRRSILTARHDGHIVGYAMLVNGVEDDPDVQRAVTIRPAAELSKMYLLPDFHAGGLSRTLMESALSAAADWNVRGVWLGVNRENQRAQRFYTKNGFKINGTRTFQVGADRRENDYVMFRDL